MIDESLYRGIDIKELQKESFTSREHLEMVRNHEIAAKAYWARNRVIHHESKAETPRRAEVVTEETQKPVKLATRRYKFTPAQLEIAIKAQQKNG